MAHDGGAAPLPPYNVLNLCRIDVTRVVETNANTVARWNPQGIPAPAYDVYGRPVYNGTYAYASSTGVNIPFAEGEYSYQKVMAREAQWRPTYTTCNSLYGTGSIEMRSNVPQSKW